MPLRRRFSHVTATVFVRSCAAVAVRFGGLIMELHLKGDGTGFEVHLKATWQRTRALLIAIGLLAPVIMRLGSVLGFW